MKFKKLIYSLLFTPVIIPSFLPLVSQNQIIPKANSNLTQTILNQDLQPSNFGVVPLQEQDYIFSNDLRHQVSAKRGIFAWNGSEFKYFDYKTRQTIWTHRPRVTIDKVFDMVYDDILEVFTILYYGSYDNGGSGPIFYCLQEIDGSIIVDHYYYENIQTTPDIEFMLVKKKANKYSSSTADNYFCVWPTSNLTFAEKKKYSQLAMTVGRNIITNQYFPSKPLPTNNHPFITNETINPDIQPNERYITYATNFYNDIYKVFIAINVNSKGVWIHVFKDGAELLYQKLPNVPTQYPKVFNDLTAEDFHNFIPDIYTSFRKGPEGQKYLDYVSFFNFYKNGTDFSSSRSENCTLIRGSIDLDKKQIIDRTFSLQGATDLDITNGYLKNDSFYINTCYVNGNGKCLLIFDAKEQADWTQDNLLTTYGNMNRYTLPYDNNKSLPGNAFVYKEKNDALLFYISNFEQDINIRKGWHILRNVTSTDNIDSNIFYAYQTRFKDDNSEIFIPNQTKVNPRTLTIAQIQELVTPEIIKSKLMQFRSDTNFTITKIEDQAFDPYYKQGKIPITLTMKGFDADGRMKTNIVLNAKLTGFKTLLKTSLKSNEIKLSNFGNVDVNSITAEQIQQTLMQHKDLYFVNLPAESKIEVVLGNKDPATGKIWNCKIYLSAYYDDNEVLQQNQKLLLQCNLSGFLATPSASTDDTNLYTILFYSFLGFAILIVLIVMFAVFYESKKQKALAKHLESKANAGVYLEYGKLPRNNQLPPPNNNFNKINQKPKGRTNEQSNK